MTTPLPPTYTVGKKITAAWLNLVANWLASAGGWQTYSPVLTAVTTNPTLGTASKAMGEYRQIGKTVRVHTVFVFGTSGIAAGNGNYAPSLPVAAAGGLGASGDPATVIGHGVLVAAGNYYPVNVVMFSGGNNIQLHYYSVASGGTRTVVAHNAPGGYASGDFLTLDFEYQAA